MNQSFLFHLCLVEHTRLLGDDAPLELGDVGQLAPAFHALSPALGIGRDLEKKKGVVNLFTDF